jgi:hypothetical protein
MVKKGFFARVPHFSKFCNFFARSISLGKVPVAPNSRRPPRDRALGHLERERRGPSSRSELHLACDDEAMPPRSEAKKEKGLAKPENAQPNPKSQSGVFSRFWPPRFTISGFSLKKRNNISFLSQKEPIRFSGVRKSQKMVRLGKRQKNENSGTNPTRAREKELKTQLMTGRPQHFAGIPGKN